MNMETTSDILIVDDNPENLRTLSATLQQYGYRVRAAIDGKTALLAAEAQAPELILLDIRMPVMNGYEVCRALKEMRQTRDVPVIFLSALDSVPDKLQAFKSGAVDYITKPFSPRELVARLKSVLRRVTPKGIDQVVEVDSLV
ncbi:MAG: response regulator, partial [Aggregatilineales bacterium]